LAATPWGTYRASFRFDDAEREDWGYVPRSRRGVPLGELWYLEELAGWLREHGRTRFLLTAPPLRLPGAVGSPAVAVATV